MKAKTIFKETDIGKIPEDWEVMNLENMSTVTDGSHFSPKSDENGSYRIATVANIKGNSIDVDSCKKIAKKDYDLLVKNGCKSEIGDVLFSKDGTVGLSFSFKQNVDLVLLSSIAIIRPNKILNSDYCAYALKSPMVFRKITNNKRGTGLRRVILRDLKSIQLPIPSLQEQQRIAEVLSTIDNTIQKSDEIIQKTELLKNRLIQELITKGIDHTKFKPSDIGSIPSEWNVTKLEDACLPEKGSVKIGPFGSQLKKSQLVENGPVKVYGQENVLSSDFSIGNRFISKEKFDTLKSFEISPGEVLVTMMGTVGFAIVVPSNITKGIMDSHLLRIRLNEKFVYTPFIVSLIRDSELLKKQVKKLSHGAIMSGLNSKLVRSLMIPIPSLSEQQKISTIISEISKKIELEIKRKNKLEQIKQGLMNDLLTGKKRLN